MIKKLRQFIIENEFDFFLQQNTDEFNSEYISPRDKRIEFISGFTGSAATLLVGREKSFFFTDGRYSLQAKQQLDENEFEIVDIASQSVFQWLELALKASKKEVFLAIDSRICNLAMKKRFENLSFEPDFDPDSSIPKPGLKLVLLEKNPIDAIWQNQPTTSNSRIYALPSNACGEDFETKRQKIIKTFVKNADLLLISKPENLCWLLNVRASDVENTPLLLAYGILQKNQKLLLFADKNRFTSSFFNAEDKVDVLPEVEFVSPNEISTTLSKLRKEFSTIQLDEQNTNCWFLKHLTKLDFKISAANCPIERSKMIKNAAEASGARIGHELDAVAMLRFWLWLENSSCDLQLDEISIGKKIDELRMQSPFCRGLSFPTIAGFAENGAVIHYRANEKTNLLLDKSSILLLDSGGQYLGDDFMATTDITRCFAIGEPNESMIRDYTLVLKGHLALSRLKFPRKTFGANLDSLARFYLWQFGKDYAHSTGHGVGAFLSVHEGLAGISRRNFYELQPGMIISNEPGFYLPGQYGIRIENLLLICEFDENFLCFETLTLVPYESKLIDFSMLTYPEKMWLQGYHRRIVSCLNPYISRQEREFLAEKSRPFLAQN